jgi:pimeloyl-ACP methyl ester carboxylesterase
MIAVGTYALPANATPVAIVVRGNSVALGPGHAFAQHVPVTINGSRIHFVVPDGVVFDGVRRGAVVTGTVRQGRVRGTFALHRGSSRIVELLGVYRGAVIAEPDGLAPLLMELPSGATHGIGATLTVGARLGDTRGNGRIVPDTSGFTWQGRHYARLRVRQREVRIGGDAATLTLPPGAGSFPGVVMVHGAGPRTRDEFDIFTAYLALQGVAVLADDKRGVGESTGIYPGDSASPENIDLLAHDAQREVAFLESQPRIDKQRVGLFGDSQAGWISPLAASRDPAIRFLISNVGPTVSVGETDYWASLAGESESPPSASRAQMLAQVKRAGPSGFDPGPALQKLDIPGLWLFGADDRNVPTELCVERLQSLQAGHDFSWAVLSSPHTPFLLPNGLLSSLPRSPGLDPRFLPAIGDWLRGHGIVR